MRVSKAILFCSLARAHSPGPPTQSDPFRGSADCDNWYTYDVEDANWAHCDATWLEDDLKFIPFNVHYKGSMSLQYTSYNNSTCNPTHLSRPMVFSIGGMSVPNDSSVDRGNWDGNSHYMSIKNTSNLTESENNSDEFAPSFTTESSSSFWYWSQIWTLDSTKTKDGFDISGNLTTTKTDGRTELKFYLPSGCVEGQETGFAYDFSTFFAWDQVWMNGRITPQTAEVVFVIERLNFIDQFGRTDIWPGEFKFSFIGKWSEDGAALLTTGPYPDSDGITVKELRRPPQFEHKWELSVSRTLTAICGAFIMFVLVRRAIRLFSKKRVAKRTRYGDEHRNNRVKRDPSLLPSPNSSSSVRHTRIY